MNPFPLCCAFTALVVLLVPLPQAGGKKPPPAQPATTDVREALARDLQGAWQLTELETKELRELSRGDVGYLLVAGEYLSFEAHSGWTDSTGQRTWSTFFSGTHRFEVQAAGVLRLSSLIGTQVNPDTGRPQFDLPGRPREYRAEISGSTLTLLRGEDGQRFTFTRLGGTEKYDFFGRRAPPKADGGGDGGKEPPK